MITSCAPMPFMRSNNPSPCRSRVPSTCSAGNLFGTTRRSHPGPLGPLPLLRKASTSGGVICSRPVQNGQYCSPMTAGRSSRKSLGRFRRSVEMITQRPVTASFLSSGILLVYVHDPSTLHGGIRQALRLIFQLSTSFHVGVGQRRVDLEARRKERALLHRRDLVGIERRPINH